MKYFISILLVISTISCSDSNNIDLYTETSIKEIIQKSVDYKYFINFLHPEVSGREIVCISGVHISENIEIYNYNKTVKIVNSQEECENQILVKLFEFTDNSTKVIFDYPIEGIRCRLYFTLDQDEWVVVDDSSSVFNRCKPYPVQPPVVW